ncbi:protein SOSEKI 1 [Salvia hispanica]|uniref:protein SOSEKI 1 n=1 Tax=Salvia hispanica TaxID=49212 RepID=UPI0020090709|nr:protein SOSEKI 1 [Salvia hispanica]
MEIQQQGGTEVRRLHIVYFLSRKGRIEHPHLIRVHHLSRNGVRLRDVKRWLAELRGKEIPESFSWSYKRRYKTGYVWQDLLDDDLITPISDNEYVLKGSEISSINVKEYPYTEEKCDSNRKDELSLEHEDNKALCKVENQTQPTDALVDVSTKPPSEIEEESPSFGSETSTFTDDSGKAEMEKSSDTVTQEKPTVKEKVSRLAPFYSTLLMRRSKKRSKNIVVDEKSVASTAPEAEAGAVAVESCKNVASSEPQCTKSKSSKSNLLKSLITCGDVGTKDSAVLPVKKQNKPFLSTCSSEVENVRSDALCRRDSGFGGSQRVFGNFNWTQRDFSRRRSVDGIEDLKWSYSSKSAEQKAACATAYKPMSGPNCSQCGKVFKPEKMHAHMKSCKGMKAISKCGAADKPSKGSGDSFFGHFVTHS